MAIRNGTKKSSAWDSGSAAPAIGSAVPLTTNVSTSPANVDPNLSQFTVIGWTSASRNITNPYDLVFHLRNNDEVISKKKAKMIWHEILRSTLKGDDLNKLGDDDE